MARKLPYSRRNRQPVDEEMSRQRRAYMKLILLPRDTEGYKIAQRAFDAGWATRGTYITLRDVVKAADDAGHGLSVTVGSDDKTAVQKERERIAEIIDRRMSYYAETIGVMFSLGVPEGERAAKLALEAIRLLQTDITVDPERLAALAEELRRDD